MTKNVTYCDKHVSSRKCIFFVVCYDATKGKPEGDLNPTQQEAFQNMDTLFKAALLSVLDDSIVDSYMSFDSGKDMWAALEATFGPSGAGNE